MARGRARRSSRSIRGYLVAVLALVALDRAVMILRWILLLRASGVAIERVAGRSHLPRQLVCRQLPARGRRRRCRARVRPVARDTRPAARRSPRSSSIACSASCRSSRWASSGCWSGVLAARWRVAQAVALAALRPGRVCGRCSGPTASLRRSSRRGSATHGPLAPACCASAMRSAATAGAAACLLHVMAGRSPSSCCGSCRPTCWGSASGIAVPFRYYLVFMPVGLLMLLLPISVSGFGLPQGVIVWLLRPLGVPDEQSFALSTLIVLTGLAGNLPGWCCGCARSRGGPSSSRRSRLTADVATFASARKSCRIIRVTWHRFMRRSTSPRRRSARRAISSGRRWPSTRPSTPRSSSSIAPSSATPAARCAATGPGATARAT